jgi:hypothetical protein
MPTLNKKWFREIGDLLPDTVRKLHAVKLGFPVGQTLTGLGWKGELVAGIGLELSPDNRRVHRGEFFLRGLPIKDPVEIAAKDLWPAAADDIKLSIQLPDAGTFSFVSGTLASEYVSGENFRYSFRKGANAIVPTDWAANNVSETTLRAVCHLDKTSNGRGGPRAKVTFLIFPRSMEEMLELSDSTQSPAWPGFRVLESTCNFFPNIPEWHDPICPIIILGGSFIDAPNIPPGQEIRFNIAAIMQSARRPTTCTKGKVLSKQWDKAMTDVEELEQEPTISWPSVPRQQPIIGKQIPSCYGNYSLVWQTYSFNLCASILSYLSQIFPPRMATEIPFPSLNSSISSFRTFILCLYPSLPRTAGRVSHPFQFLFPFPYPYFSRFSHLKPHLTRLERR